MSDLVKVNKVEDVMQIDKDTEESIARQEAFDNFKETILEEFKNELDAMLMGMDNQDRLFVNFSLETRTYRPGCVFRRSHKDLHLMNKKTQLVDYSDHYSEESEEEEDDRY